jgi:hypothetical protein
MTVALVESPTMEVFRTLDENEEIITRGLGTYVEVGLALGEIRRAKLYKEAGFKTWEDYCHERWDMGHNNADKTISAALVTDVLDSALPKELPRPQSVRQALPLAKVLEDEGEDAVRETWQGIIDGRGGDDKPITGREVRAAVARPRGSSGKPSAQDLMGTVGDILAKADAALVKFENSGSRGRKAADMAARYADTADDMTKRLRVIVDAASATK